MSERAQLPAAIAAYQEAHDRRDTEAALACFAPHATVLDDGATHVGTEQIRDWLDRAASEFTFTRTLTGVDRDGDDEVVVRNHLAGDFPGGTVDLQYRFQLADGAILRLEIAP